MGMIAFVFIMFGLAVLFLGTGIAEEIEKFIKNRRVKVKPIYRYYV